jgi:hypothetical protein
MMRCSLRAPFRCAALRQFSVYYEAIAADKRRDRRAASARGWRSISSHG